MAKIPRGAKGGSTGPAAVEGLEPRAVPPLDPSLVAPAVHLPPGRACAASLLLARSSPPPPLVVPPSSSVALDLGHAVNLSPWRRDAPPPSA
jgi:hypothetical protein